ncbi:Transcription factor mbp1 [Coemansia spiralis]|nr:Transcription factor mbp1 [Coemansia spiralis]
MSGHDSDGPSPGPLFDDNPTDGNEDIVWSASYAGVDVLQKLHNGSAVMKRRSDSYVNVTQVLKCAGYNKAQRTRFLEREIHTGPHEKVQGGYGKYQGMFAGTRLVRHSLLV